jgi:hypothetical protein
MVRRVIIEATTIAPK